MSLEPTPQSGRVHSGDGALSVAEHTRLLDEQYHRIVRQREHLEAMLRELEEDESAIKHELSRLSSGDRDIGSQRIDGSTCPPCEVDGLSIWMFGGFKVEVRGAILIGDGTDRPSPVFRYLAAAGPTGVHKERLATQFWPDADPKTARRNLHQAIYNIRRQFGEYGAEGELMLNGDRYVLGVEGVVWRDIDEMEHLVDAARVARHDGNETASIDLYRRADAVYGGEFLSDYPYDEWAFADRERFRTLHREAAAAVLAHGREAGDQCTVLQLASRLLMLDPCDEDACRHLMRAHLALDQPHLAVMAFAALTEQLRRVHGVDPLPETSALAAELRSK